MNKLLIAGVFLMLSAMADAGETGIINQAGPYEATMRFYLHPAHGFPGKAESIEPGVKLEGLAPAQYVYASPVATKIPR